MEKVRTIANAKPISMTPEEYRNFWVGCGFITAVLLAIAYLAFMGMR